jgi:hypothetical protein
MIGSCLTPCRSCSDWHDPSCRLAATKDDVRHTDYLLRTSWWLGILASTVLLVCLHRRLNHKGPLVYVYVPRTVWTTRACPIHLAEIWIIPILMMICCERKILFVRWKVLLKLFNIFWCTYVCIERRWIPRRSANTIQGTVTDYGAVRTYSYTGSLARHAFGKLG